MQCLTHHLSSLHEPPRTTADPHAACSACAPRCLGQRGGGRGYDRRRGSPGGHAGGRDPAQSPDGGDPSRRVARTRPASTVEPGPGRLRPTVPRPRRPRSTTSPPPPACRSRPSPTSCAAPRRCRRRPGRACRRRSPGSTTSPTRSPASSSSSARRCSACWSATCSNPYYAQMAQVVERAAFGTATRRSSATSRAPRSRRSPASRRWCNSGSRASSSCRTSHAPRSSTMRCSAPASRSSSWG